MTEPAETEMQHGGDPKHTFLYPANTIDHERAKSAEVAAQKVMRAQLAP